jgi:hypothetical protein
MVTTGELRSIVQELHLIDIGDAESYLGEEKLMEEESAGSTGVSTPVVQVTDSVHLAMCGCTLVSSFTFKVLQYIICSKG